MISTATTTAPPAITSINGQAAIALPGRVRSHFSSPTSAATIPASNSKDPPQARKAGIPKGLSEDVVGSVEEVMVPVAGEPHGV